MNPQPGDIWQYVNKNEPDDDGLVIIIEPVPVKNPHASWELQYLGYDMKREETDVFIFNSHNFHLWSRRA